MLITPVSYSPTINEAIRQLLPAKIAGKPISRNDILRACRKRNIKVKDGRIPGDLNSIEAIAFEIGKERGVSFA